MDMRRIHDDADEMPVKSTAQPLRFNPFLAMAVKGMWSTTFTQAVIEALEQEDPDPTPESEAA